MPALAHHRHELFAQARAKGANNGPAYQAAGFKELDGARARDHGCKLARRPEVADRIRELKAEQVASVGITVPFLVKDLYKAYRLGMRTRQPAAAVGAHMAIAKLLGLVVDRSEVEATLRRPMREPGSAGSMSLDEWKDKFAPKPVLTSETKPEGSA